jgi:hypothetical protein
MIKKSSKQDSMTKRPNCFGSMAEMLDYGEFVENCLQGQCLKNGIHLSCYEESIKRIGAKQTRKKRLENINIL